MGSQIRILHKKTCVHWNLFQKNIKSSAGTRCCAPMLSACNLTDRASSGICREWLVRWLRRIASAPKAHVETCASVGGCLHTIPDARDSCGRGHWGSATPCQPSSHAVFRFSSSTKRQTRLPKYVRCKMQFFIYSFFLQTSFLGHMPVLERFASGPSSTPEMSK